MPFEVQTPVDRSYNSEDDKMLLPSKPPVTSTLPFDNNVAEWIYLKPLKLPVEVQIPVDGSYNSEDDKEALLISTPPVTSTLPFDNSVDEWTYLPTLILPVEVQTPMPEFIRDELAVTATGEEIVEHPFDVTVTA